MTDISREYTAALEEEIVENLAEIAGLDLSSAMDAYYRSRLAQQIAEGELGLQYLSAKYLAEDLVENEPELFPLPLSPVASAKAET